MPSGIWLRQIFCRKDRLFFSDGQSQYRVDHSVDRSDRFVRLFLRHGNGVFVAQPYRLKNLTDNGNKRAKLAYKLVDNYDELISSVLVGNNIVNISASSLATVLFIKAFGDNGPTVSTIAMTIIVLIFGEVTPKSIAKESPEAFAMFSAPIINVLIYVFKPINVCLVGIKKLVKNS